MGSSSGRNWRKMRQMNLTSTEGKTTLRIWVNGSENNGKKENQRNGSLAFPNQQLKAALGQIMLYVDGMNGVINHSETIQWLYTLVGSKFRLVVKTALKLLLVFVEYSESNAPLLIQAVSAVDTKRGIKPWSNIMEILEEKDGVDTELLVYAMTLVNKTLAGLPDQDTFYDVVDCLEELGIAAVSQRHLNKKGTDLDLLEQFNIYESTFLFAT
ncbi:hypothetical protein STEG23_002185, partial [Scotinomys teguina]